MVLAPLLLLHFGLAAAIVSGIARLGLIPWRKARDAHWTVRARLLWPVRKASALLSIAVPVSLAAAQLLLFPDLPLTWLLTALAGLAGAILGAWPMAQAIFPERPFVRWLRDLGTIFVIRLLLVVVWIAAACCMPSSLGAAAIVITAAVATFTLWLIYGGMVWLLRVTGLLVSPPPRLTGIVSAVAARMHLPLPRLGVLRGFGANAVAFPPISTLLVTEGALAALPDDELAAVCAHEFAHLSEPTRVVATRTLAAFVLLPGLFFKPVIEAWGFPGYCVLLAAIVLLSRLIVAFRRRMEKRADSMATVHEGASPGTYARALERIYEINQVPAVISGLLTHPNLYDRLLAAGVTPAYPRPSAPPRIAWQQVLAMVLLVASVAAVIIRISAGSH